MGNSSTGPGRVDRRRFLQTLGAGALTLLARQAFGQSTQSTQPASRPPNIVILLADDLGYADLGCQGSKEALTPFIDSIAAAGIRFTSGYVSCPVCSPSRAGLLTGRYQNRFGHEFNPGPDEPSDFGLPKDEVTIAEALKAAGYATGMVGKWHEGSRAESQPTRRGFDEFFGFLSGAHSYTKLNTDGQRSIFRNHEPVTEKDYLTDAFSREAVAFIDRHQRQPFFLYLAFNAVHLPLEEAPQKYMDRFPHIEDPKRRRCLAMLAAMDDAVGAVLAKLRAAGLEENTLVIFLSDNGGPTNSNTSRNDPLRGGKGSVYEGGIRIPFMLQWKGKLPAGKVDDRPVISLDLFPTALALAGANAQPKLIGDRKLDGLNLLPYLSGQNPARPHEMLFWRFGSHAALRQGDWKLIRGSQTEGGPRGPQLYDLASDIGEQRNLAAEQPQRFKQLSAAWETFNAQMKPPRWPPGRDAKGAKDAKGKQAAEE